MLSDMPTFNVGVQGDKNNKANFLDQCGPKGFRRLSKLGASDLSSGADHRRRERRGGHRQAPEGNGAGVLESALPYRGNAFRVVYAVQIGAELWVVHAFRKKSTHGIKTPKHEIDLVEARVKRLKEMLR